MKRIRLGTLMLAVVIVALVVALVVERRRSNGLLARAERDRARLTETIMLLETEFVAMRDQAARQEAIAAKATADAKPAGSPSR